MINIKDLIKSDFLTEIKARYKPTKYNEVGKVVEESTNEEELFEDIELFLAGKYNISKKEVNKILKEPYKI